MSNSKHFSRREKILLLILALLVLGSGYYFFVHQPVTDALERCAQQTDTLNTDITILTAKKQKQDEMQKELDEIKAQGNPPIVPDYDNLDKEIAFLYSVLETTFDYKLSVQSVQKAEDSSNIVRRSMALSFTCPNYSDAKRAIRMLQESPYCCRLGATSITRSTANTSKAVIGNAATAKNSRSIMEGAVVVQMNITFFEHIV